MKTLVKILSVLSMIVFVALALSGCQSTNVAPSAETSNTQTASENTAKLAEENLLETEAVKQAQRLAEEKRQFALQLSALRSQLPADVKVIENGGPIDVLVVYSEEKESKVFTEDHIKIIINGENGFVSGQSKISKKFAELLNRVATSVIEFRNKLLVVNVHTDSVGSDKLNQTLSEKRALTVAKHLFGAGLNKPNQIVVNGYGESQPLTDNLTAKGRSQNRRVELVILPPGSVESEVLIPAVAASAPVTAGK